MTFYLQDASNGRARAAANTLANADGQSPVFLADCKIEHGGHFAHAARRVTIQSLLSEQSMLADRYKLSLTEELRHYESCIDVHDLPGIFHYWTNTHILPKLLPFGFSSPAQMFAQYLQEQCDLEPNRSKRFVSLGCGNCDLEITLALQLQRQLQAQGRDSDFIFDCLDVNPAMLERGRAAAEEKGIGGCLSFIHADLNTWSPAAEYDAAIANQSLHHVVNLEHLCERVRDSLRPDGSFVISDMIGRNGHQRWPEALAIVHEFWQGLPPSYRFNRNALRYEDLFEDFDCSGEGFEGVRAQDILPVLLANFEFRVFIPFGNVIDPFVDRSFGPNFDPSIRWDREFIDAVHARDEAEISAGRLTPTHILAVAGTKAGTKAAMPRQVVEASVRAPDRVVTPEQPAPRVTVFSAGPHGMQRELERACARLNDSADRIRQLTAWASELEATLQTRTAAFLNLESEFEKRTEWALDLDRQMQARTEWALNLDAELKGRTAWALQLQTELEKKTLRAEQLEREIRERPRLRTIVAAAIRDRLTRVLRTAGLRRELN